MRMSLPALKGRSKWKGKSIPSVNARLTSHATRSSHCQLPNQPVTGARPEHRNPNTSSSMYHPPRICRVSQSPRGAPRASPPSSGR